MFRAISFSIRFIASNFNEFLGKNGPYMSAAIAFYAFFSLFPLSLAIIAVFSLVLGIAGADAYISYDHWLFSDLGETDSLQVAVSNDDGENWTLVESVASTGSEWQRMEFLVSEFVSPTAQVRVRFRVADNPNDSITEAGLDNFRVDVLGCGVTFVRGDCNGDGPINIADAIFVLNGLFGADPPVATCESACDANGDESKNIADGIYLLNFLFGDNPPPPAPWPDCGASPDPLACEAYSPCR